MLPLNWTVLRSECSCVPVYSLLNVTLQMFRASALLVSISARNVHLSEADGGGRRAVVEAMAPKRRRQLNCARDKQIHRRSVCELCLTSRALR